MDEEKDVLCNQTETRPHLGCEKISRYQNVHVISDEFSPGRLLSPLIDRWRPARGNRGFLTRSQSLWCPLPGPRDSSEPRKSAYIPGQGRPHLLFSRANLKISDSTSGGNEGRQAGRRYWEPANLCATGLACQRSIVSGLTIVAMASRAFRPSCFPILASCRRSPSLSRSWPFIFDRRIRFSLKRYSFQSRSSSSMEQVTLASSFFPAMQDLQNWSRWKKQERDWRMDRK